MLVVLALALAAGEARAAAAERVHGVVLSVDPGAGEVVVRHDPFGGMPAMTMPFRVAPRGEARILQPGNEIEATADRSTDPWTLRNVSVMTTVAVTSQPQSAAVPLHVGDLVPDTPLLDQFGRPFRFSQLRGQNVVLSFIYTRCQDPRMCPLISAKFNALQQRSAGRSLHLVEVTLDPSYDRPPVLLRYARTFGANPARWTLAVGDAQPTSAFAARFGIVAFPDPSVGIIHTENTVIVGRDGRIGDMIADTSWQPDEILADVDAVNGAAHSPIARLDRWLVDAAVAVCGSSVAGFSGLGDLAVVLVIFAALAYLVFRLARGIFAKPV